MKSGETKASDVIAEIRRLGDATMAERAQGFFKTGKGEYGEGDKFVGVRVPVLRALVKTHQILSQKEVMKLLRSQWHEVRLFALFLWVKQYGKGDDTLRKTIYTDYLDHTRFINNWDLVDCSAPAIVGAHLTNANRKVLYKLVESNLLWERRIAIVACFHFIRQDDYSDALALFEKVLADREDLIHKASGWMLREIGKRNIDAAEQFLQQHYLQMPRTMLRYALEKFTPERRQAYMKGLV
ncbi:3-methyladenine DNA glycosylase AlkD [Alteromonadaceae bacterium 2753L.S.0a.02]|nr:3-methyladenine DNA glycosylase AlkD [Alteromonadaceae bacterium 2753L.S.0a.02]